MVRVTKLQLISVKGHKSQTERKMFATTVRVAHLLFIVILSFAVSTNVPVTASLFSTVFTKALTTLLRLVWAWLACRGIHPQTLSLPKIDAGIVFQCLFPAFRQIMIYKKTRHDNLDLFMGSCMNPPRLAIVTGLCKGQSLHNHIQGLKEKNQTIITNQAKLIGQHIAQVGSGTAVRLR